MSNFYRSKPRVVKAMQWTPPVVKPEVYPWSDNRPGLKNVRLIGSDHAVIQIGNGQPFKLHPRDWIIFTADKPGYEVYSDQEFKKLFEPI